MHPTISLLHSQQRRLTQIVSSGPYQTATHNLHYVLDQVDYGLIVLAIKRRPNDMMDRYFD